MDDTFNYSLTIAKNSIKKMIETVEAYRRSTDADDVAQRLKYNRVLNRLDTSLSCLDSIISEDEASVVEPFSVIDETLLTEKDLTDTVLPLLPALRSNMTPITRFLKMQKPETLSFKEYADKNARYKEGAVTAADNILNLINHSRRLAEVEYKLTEFKKRTEKES